MEHHSNILPGSEACLKAGAKLVYVYLKDGGLDLEGISKKLIDRTKFVSIAHASNVLGVINPVQEIASLAHEKGAIVVVDGAQSVLIYVNRCSKLDADFFVFFWAIKWLDLQGLESCMEKSNISTKCHLLNLVEND